MGRLGGAARVHQSVSTQADTAAILALATAIDAVTALIPDAGAMTSIAQQAFLAEFEQHFHNVERWWGAVGAPDETNAIDANVDTPFAATSGADAWGAAISILGTGDNPVLAGMDEFDCREILITDLDSDTTPWRLRIIWGAGTSGDAITAGQWSERMIETNAVPGNRAGGVPVPFMMPHLDIGTKLWAQSWNDTGGEILSFFWGTHGYPYPP